MKHLSRRPHGQRQFSDRSRGFTLVEILVVLAIVAILGTILFAAFKSVREGNNRSSCQGNLVQIYQATRLYGQDFNGELPYFNPGAIVPMPANSKAPQNGLGLWALYGYSASNNLDCDGITTKLPDPNSSSTGVAPLASYVKTPRVFHCPLDQFDRTAINTAGQNGCSVPAGTTIQSDALQYTDAGGNEHLNPFYLSYQGLDKGIASSMSGADRSLYSSFRASEARRQLVYYKADQPSSLNSPVKVNLSARAQDTTIITWCPYHRATDKNGVTIEKPSNHDNVLFLDGTVQYLPTKQTIGNVTCQGWQRVPIEVANLPQYANATECPTSEIPRP